MLLTMKALYAPLALIFVLAACSPAAAPSQPTAAPPAKPAGPAPAAPAAAASPAPAAAAPNAKPEAKPDTRKQGGSLNVDAGVEAVLHLDPDQMRANIE